MDDAREPWTRRRLFVRDALKGTLVFVIGPSLYAFGRQMERRGSTDRVETASAGSADDFLVGASRLVYVGDQKVLVMRAVDGSYHALGAECTHMGCSVRFEPKQLGNEVACNWHKSRFDLSGRNLTGPAPMPLLVFDVSVVGRDILVTRRSGS